MGLLVPGVVQFLARSSTVELATSTSPMLPFLRKIRHLAILAVPSPEALVALSDSPRTQQIKTPFELTLLRSMGPVDEPIGFDADYGFWKPRLLSLIRPSVYHHVARLDRESRLSLLSRFSF